MRNGIVTAGLIAALGAVAYGCGGTDTTGSGGSTTGETTTATATSSASGTGGTGSTATSTATATSSAVSSGTGTPVVCTPSDGVVLGIETLDFGDFGMDTSASQKLGFNVDALVSTAQSTDLCMPVAGADKTKVYEDGDMGIDNSFGKNVLPLLLNLSPGFSETTTNNISDGKFTMMLDFVGLTAAGDQPMLTTRLYGGTDLGSPPSFDGKDCWPVAPELLTDPTDIKSSTVVFDKSAVSANTWTSGVAATITLAVPTGPTTITLTIHKAQISLNLSADHKSAMGGIIGGVLDTEEFIKEIKKAIYSLDPAYCALIGTVEKQIRGYSDILNDGTQDKAKTCNGISIGFGFTMKEVQLGGVGPKATPAAGACMP
jgi:hypothetical protein